MKCDAKRPCSTCVRSHAHALLHAAPGANLPTEPECTFDKIAEAPPASENPKSRYERLESRINELMALLVEKEKGAENGLHIDVQARLADLSSIPPETRESRSMIGAEDVYLSPSGMAGPSTTSPTLVGPSGPVSGFGSAMNLASSSALVLPQTGVSPRLLTASPQASQITWPNWPQKLPDPELLRHLIEVFFVFHPHANRVFHASSFLANLSLAPNHPRFPATCVLHAICAMASFYTAAVTSPPLPDLNRVQADEIFQARNRVRENRPDSFAEEQAKYAKEEADKLEVLGEDLFQMLQARVILNWFYWSHGRWVEVVMGAGHALRIALPLGLNVCPPFHSITNSVRPLSILPQARSVIEDETRRNVFWLAYALERQHGSGNGWALSLDDGDISQLLPVRNDQFDAGTLVPPQERQWAHTRDLVLVHPDQQVDSFILYIKSCVLLSKVKTFNLRFRSKHFAGDPSVMPIPDYSPMAKEAPDPVDPRGSPSFIELDTIISKFRTTFPPHLRNPVLNNIVDSNLYVACLTPHTCIIILHDPHADARRAGCMSALKILTASRAILELIYAVCSTSFDISLLDPFCIFCWFTAGRTLVRFLKAAIDSNSLEQVNTLRSEVTYVQSAIAKMGERLPLAYRFAKILSDLVVQRCGVTMAMATPTATVEAILSPQSVMDKDITGEMAALQRYIDENTPILATLTPSSFSPTIQDLNPYSVGL